MTNQTCQDCGLEDIELFGGLCEDCDTEMFATFWTGDWEKPLYRDTQWYNMSKIQDMRNDFRFRKAARRTQTKNLVDSGLLDQLRAIDMGLTDDPRKEDPANIPLTDHHNNVRVWEWRASWIF